VGIDSTDIIWGLGSFPLLKPAGAGGFYEKPGNKIPHFFTDNLSILTDFFNHIANNTFAYV
jgi:hypothetical protein